jgi:hypothetical protein
MKLIFITYDALLTKVLSGLSGELRVPSDEKSVNHTA